MGLTQEKKRELLRAARSLKPVMQIGKAGVTPGVRAQLIDELERKELIKVRFLRSFLAQHGKKAEHIARLTQSVCLGKIGNVVIFYQQRRQV